MKSSFFVKSFDAASFIFSKEYHWPWNRFQIEEIGVYLTSSNLFKIKENMGITVINMSTINKNLCNPKFPNATSLCIPGFVSTKVS